MPPLTATPRRRVGAALAVCAVALALAVPTGAFALPTLHHGDRGRSVVRLQHALHIGADGVFGRGTVRAVKRFQRRHGLEVDGVVGPQTAAALGLTPHRANRRHRSGIRAELHKIALCESGGDSTAVSASGTYRGKYQFDRATWRSLGGHGDPAAASERTQDHLAAKLYRQSGGSAWPNCA
jgi:Transglycosylase-like domain/Putative peptidoglycan binding domain